MKITIKETRHFVSIGLKYRGETVEVDEEFGNQLIRQKLAEKFVEPKKVKEE